MWKHVPHDWMRKLCQKHRAIVWLSAELWPCSARGLGDDSAGRIELRCHCESENRMFMDDFVVHYLSEIPATEGLYIPCHTPSRAATFKCLAQRITRNDLSFPSLTARLIEFMKHTGSFKQ